MAMIGINCLWITIIGLSWGREVNSCIFTWVRDVRAAIFPVAAGTHPPTDPPAPPAPLRPPPPTLPLADNPGPHTPLTQTPFKLCSLFCWLLSAKHCISTTFCTLGPALHYVQHTLGLCGWNEVQSRVYPPQWGEAAASTHQLITACDVVRAHRRHCEAVMLRRMLPAHCCAPSLLVYIIGLSWAGECTSVEMCGLLLLI